VEKVFNAPTGGTMKGVVFTEFFEFVEGRFSPEIAEQIIESSALPSKGIYTSVGTYDHGEMVTIVSNLAAMVEIGVSDLLKDFGRHLLKQFFIKFPQFFEGITSTFEFLPKVDSFVHVEVKKLYPDAELPTFSCVFPISHQLQMTYESDRNLPDLAEGLILGCLEHFGEKMEVVRNSVPGNPCATLFTITRVRGAV
jgi:hypothetical protein